MLTDFLHLSGFDFHLSEPQDTPGRGDNEMEYSTDAAAWNFFFVVAFIAGIGLATSLVSLFIIHENVRVFSNRFFGWGFVIIIQMLNALGVYLGRFIRFNTWDILADPLSIISETIHSIDRFMIYFTGGFTLLGMFAYLFFYTAVYMNSRGNKL